MWLCTCSLSQRSLSTSITCLPQDRLGFMNHPRKRKRPLPCEHRGEALEGVDWLQSNPYNPTPPKKKKAPSHVSIVERLGRGSIGSSVADMTDCIQGRRVTLWW